MTSRLTFNLSVTSDLSRKKVARAGLRDIAQPKEVEFQLEGGLAPKRSSSSGLGFWAFLQWQYEKSVLCAP
jgi:hypothetical protein